MGARRDAKGRRGEGNGEGWWVGTFHHLGARLLRCHAEAVGLTPNFTILDQDDQVRLVKQFMSQPRGNIMQNHVLSMPCYHPVYLSLFTYLVLIRLLTKY